MTAPTPGLDRYTQATIKAKVQIDSASRVFWDGKELEVHNLNGVRKIQLPGTKIMLSLQDLLEYGAKLLGGLTANTLAKRGADARWANARKHNLPANVYIANARSIDHAVKTGKVPPPVRYLGRRRDKMTEVYDSIEEVVAAMNEGRWRNPDEYRRGHAQKWMIPKKPRG